jgi:tRNA pseudouridine65 synthase
VDPVNPPPTPALGATSIELLYDDAHLVIANKPSGLLVHRGWARDDDTALFRVRDAVGSWVYPLHRLDRGTSGTLLFARTKEATAPLSALFQNGLIQKSYLALVRGVPPLEGTIDYAIPRSEDGERVPAVTHFRLVAASTTERCSLVEAKPETGRLHQVRRHLCHIGHPLVGDVKHGRGDINRKYRAEYQLQRLALHAYRVSFEHPFTRQALTVSAELPLDLVGPLSRLGLPTALPSFLGP